MGRARALLLGVAVVGALVVVPGTGAAAGTGEAGSGAGECTWQRHSKRVVKHVKRHGRKRRLVRTRHWWTCEPGSGASATPAPVPVTPPAPPPSEPEPVANRVGVKSRDNPAYAYTLSRPQADAGAITIELNNEGEDPHNLNIQLEGSAEPAHSVGEAAPGQQKVATFDLPPGTYRLWCSLPTHDEQGMHATLILE
jgi:Copper binding proteins, plastocyanin/azurin family